MDPPGELVPPETPAAGAAGFVVFEAKSGSMRRRRADAAFATSMLALSKKIPEAGGPEVSTAARS